MMNGDEYSRSSRNSETVFSRRSDEFWHSSKSTIRQSSSDSTLRILLGVSFVVVVVVGVCRSFNLFALVLIINCSKCSNRVIGETLRTRRSGNKRIDHN